MWDFIIVGLGSAIGGMLRFAISGFFAERYGTSFPLGTLIVNVTGSLLIGFLASVAAPDSRFLISPATRSFLMLGICGGYTTFSSFSLQTLSLVQEGEWLYAGTNIVGSVVLCLVAVWLGYLLGQLLN